MSDNIGRLKELLFDSEAQTLADLARRLETLAADTTAARSELTGAIKALAETEHRTRADISTRIDAIAARVGNDAQLEESVAVVLDGALRKADAVKHDVVSEAVAPFVVRTVRTELRNSRDELVEALYPVTGRIVKSYVASAMKDLVAQINRRLEANPVMLRLRSIATGRSVAELAIADSQRLALADLYLIRRGTGELVESWPGGQTGGNRDHVMSGVLAAINDFATEAFEAEGNALRQIDLGGDCVYLRESLTYLLAAKCEGSAGADVEKILDEAFLEAIDKLGPAGAADARPPVLATLADTITARLDEKYEELNRRSGFSPLKVVAWVIGLPLAAWLGWTFYADWQTSRVDRIAHTVLAESEEIRGYPARVSTGWLGRTMTVSGLAPTAEARDRVLQRLTDALPSTELRSEFAVVPNALADVEPELERLRGKTAGLEPRIGAVRDDVEALARKMALDAERRDVERATRRIARAKATLESTVADLDADQQRRARDALAALDQALSDLANAGGSEDGRLLASVTERTREASRTIAGMLAARPPSDRATTELSSTAAAATVAAAEEIDIFSVALAQTAALKRALPTPSPREQLERWTRANAVFFSEDTAYRDPDAARRQIGELAALMKNGGDTVLRLVGYTDELGNATRNSPLSLSRAQKVAEDLLAAGVPASRIVAVGRPTPLDISADTGFGSPNRRVEFEIGFEGEARR